MINWPVPTSVKQLRGFLALTCFYRRLTKNYASIAYHLIELLRKDSFQWSPRAQKSFESLKLAMTTAQYYNYQI